MIAIIDSGSTKADWIFTDGNKTNALYSSGMNPNFINEQEVARIINESIVKNIQVNEVQKIFYFGTGCSGKASKEIIFNALKKIFVNAEIHVDHDIMGAAIAACGNERGIACIIGTGSNSVYFDGNKIHENNFGLGFILADEGAGTYLGKKIITHYLYNLLPQSLASEFRKEYNLTRDDVIKNVYGNPTANTWLGSFASFYTIHKDDAWVRNTVKAGFREFIELFVKNFNDYKNIPVHFIGSIAFHFKEILNEVAEENNLRMGKVIQKPIDELTAFYIKQNFPNKIQL